MEVLIILEFAPSLYLVPSSNNPGESASLGIDQMVNESDSGSHKGTLVCWTPCGVTAPLPSASKQMGQGSGSALHLANASVLTHVVSKWRDSG